MHKCKNCNTELILGKNTTQSYLNNSDYKCRYCRKIRHDNWVKNNYDKSKRYFSEWKKENREKYLEDQRKYYHENKDGVFTVYLLKDGYVGCTQHTSNRLSIHRKRRGYDGKFLCVLYQTNDKYEATELEDLLHDMGYKGKHKQNKPYWANVI